MADLTSNQVCNICCIHYNAGLRCCALGSAVEGGRLVAKGGSIAWIVAPSTTQVTRSWYARADAVTTAQAAAACGDWFVPSRNDLILGISCSSFWDSISNAAYWSNTQSSCVTNFRGWTVIYNPTARNGNYFINSATCLTATCPVRAFRRVLY